MSAPLVSGGKYESSDSLLRPLAGRRVYHRVGGGLCALRVCLVW